MRQPIPFAGPSLTGRSKKVQSGRTVNMYAVSEQEGAKAPIAMYSDPGLRQIAVAGVGPCRSDGHPFGDSIHFASNNEVVAFDDSLAPVSLGTLSTTAGRVRMASNNTRMLVVDGTQGKNFSGGTFGNIASANFPDDATYIDILDGYFVANNPANPGRFYVSADGNTWNATDFGTAEAITDPLLALAVHGRDLQLFGSRSIEIWNNVNAAGGVPFRRHPNGVLQWGIAANDSLAKSSLGTVFLGNVAEGEIKILLLRGFQVEVLSQEWVEWRIGQMGRINDAIGFVYQQNGQWYYQLTFPEADITFVYMFSQKWWYERKSWGIGRHRATGHGYIARTHVVGEYAGGNFYALDFDHYYDNEDPFERSRRSMAVHKGGNLLTFYEVAVEFKGGVGRNVDGARNPNAQLRFSDNGGETWSMWLSAPIGPEGDYETVAVWRKLGQSRERVFEVRVTDPVDVIIVQAFANVELSDH